MKHSSVYFVVEGQPIPKARPRLGRGGHVYTPGSTQAWEQCVATEAALAMRGQEPLAGDLSVAVVFRREGKRRADTDNLIKGVLDAANRIVWEDDKQVTAIYAYVVYGHKEPGVSVLVEAA